MAKKNKKKLQKNSMVLIVTSVLVAILGLVWFRSQTTNQVEYYVADHEQREIFVGDKKLTVEVVITPESLSQGLSGRRELGAEGMLFLFDRKRTVSFWMKEMEFDLDMIWIADNKIVGIVENVPKPVAGTPLQDLPTYSSEVPINAVLEVNAGSAQKFGLNVGDKVSLPLVAPR